MKKRATQGFTLIELLVASGVTAIIVGLMITMVSNLLTAYNRSSGALSAQSQAGLVLDQLSTELESIVLRKNDDFMFVVQQVGELSEEKNSPTDIEIPPDGTTEFPRIEDYKFGEGGLWLKFFTAAPSLTDDPTPGVKAIGYRMDFNPVAPGASESSYMLYRTQIPAQITFEWGYNLGDYNLGSYTYSYVDENDEEQTVTEPNGLAPNPLLEDLPQQIIADNVIDFGVRLFTIDPTTRARSIVFPTSPSQTYAASGLETTDDYPNVVEVMVRILTPEGRRLIRALEESQPIGLTFEEVVDQNSAVFSRVINIPSRPL